VKRVPWRAAGIAAVWVVDRLTKLWALDSLLPLGSIQVFPFFHLTYVENTGAAFGIGFSRNGFFTVLSTILLAGLAYVQRGWPRTNRWLQAGLVLVAGGALGNLYDRLAYGYVVDFLDFRVWPVFNAADSCVTVGACCLFWGLRLEEKRTK
jgi:signal peptidase II